MKVKFRQILSMVLVFAIVFSTFASNSLSANAANTAVVSLSGMGSHGTMNIGGKTKSGTWWKMHVGSKEAFCLTLGATCHAGNTYEVTEKCTWDQNTGGEKRGYYAKIFKWYVVNCKRSKKSFIMSQALLWSASEGHTSESQLKNVIKQVKDNTGYYASRSVDSIYNAIFETSDNFEVKATYWKKTGSSKGYQTLLTVDAEETDEYKPYHLHMTQYYRQRVNVVKKDNLGNPLGGIKFRLDVDNIDELYSFSVGDANGTDMGNADTNDDTEFSLEGTTRDDGTIGFRMTYRLQSYDEVYYYPDELLALMSESEFRAAKKHLTDDLELEEGIDFGPGLNKAQAEDIANEQIEDQLEYISNGYTLTETDTSAQPNVIADPTFASGYKFTLNNDNSWIRRPDATWEDSQLENPETHPLAYSVGVTNNLKKATVTVVKKDSHSNDGKAHGDATLDGAKFQLYSDAACTTKATVYDENGNEKEAGVYTTSNGTFETDCLMTGVSYYLKEIEAPTGYLISDEVKEISIDGGNVSFEHNSANQEVKDAPILGKVAIQKYFKEDDPNFLNPEPGAVFQVYLKEAGSYDKANADYERDEITTDDKGYACTKDLYYGKYIVHQVSSGPVDTINVDDFEVDVTENGKTYTYPLKNPYFKAYLKILKKDKNTEKQVLKAGTAYQIYKVSADGKEEKVVQSYEKGGQKVNVDTFITDATGEITTVEPLKSGTYRIYETDSATGLHITDKYIEVTINSKLNNYTEETDADGYKHITITVSYFNEETYGRFYLKKVGEQLVSFDAVKKEFVFNENNLEGVEFEVYADGDIKTQDNQGTNWFNNGDLVATIISGKEVKYTKDIKGITASSDASKDGAVAINLPLGKYIVKEKKTMYGYVLPKDTEWKLEFNWVNSKDEFVLNTTNATDKSGVLCVKNSLCDTKVRLLKLDNLTSKGIAGATFGLYTKNDIYNAKGEKIVDADTLLTTIITDASGDAFSTLKVPVMDDKYKESASGDAKLNSGDYYLKELSISDSYYLEQSEIPLHFEYKDEKTDTIELSVKKTNIHTFTEIDKLTVAGNEELDGCKLKVSDTDGNVIVSWTSGDMDSVKLNDDLKSLGYENVTAFTNGSGNLIIQGLLHDKEYILSETKPAAGYVTAKDIHFMVKQNASANASGEAILTKVASSEAIGGNMTSADASANAGVDASFDASANVSSDASKDASAEASENVISSEVFGDDSIVAIKNEDGVFVDKTDAKVIMYDDVTNIKLLKLAGDNGQGLGGAKFVVYDSKGKEVMRFSTTDEGFEIVGKLVIGETYTFKEISAPEGYKIAKPVKYTVKDTSEWQTIKIKDEKIPDKPPVPQTGGGSFPIMMFISYIAALAIMEIRVRRIVKARE